MSDESGLSDLDFAALVSSRICHDIISPVGAIANGLEVIEEEADQEMREHAMQLIRRSADQASAKLQFARLAFGAAGSAGAEIELAEAEKVARAVAETDKHALEWNAPAFALAKDRVKLLLNMVTLALGTLPRGGTITVSVTGGAADPAFEVRARGESVKTPEDLQTMLSGGNGKALDAHSIQPYYAVRVAEASGFALNVAEGEGEVSLKAAKAA